MGLACGYNEEEYKCIFSGDIACKTFIWKTRKEMGV
jgi:hypothetical protein